jgi:hypothetical protein
MGLESRDWYREKPVGQWPEVATRPKRSGIRVGRALLVAVLATAALMTFMIIRGQTRSDASQVRPTLRIVPSLPVGRPALSSPDPKIVHLAPRPELDIRATRVTRWSVTDPRFGKVIVYVPVGKTPREALTVALAGRGYQVVK